MARPVFASETLRAFFGTTLTPFPAGEFPAVLRRCREDAEAPVIIGHHNLHSLYLCQRDDLVASFYGACTHCYIDGMPLLWILRGLGVRERAARFSLMDCLPELLDFAEQTGWRVCYLGGTPTVIERAGHWLTAQWPALTITLIDGYRDEQESYRLVSAARPDLLLVGMGMPKQEGWIMQYAAQLPPCVILQAGGTLDYFTGAQRKPPAAFSRMGLGWLHRLVHDPRRLWRRYLVEPWGLLVPLLRLRRALRNPRPKHGDANQG